MSIDDAHQPSRTPTWDTSRPVPVLYWHRVQPLSFWALQAYNPRLGGWAL